MALKINKNIVRENIEDLKGNVIGVIEFDPDDERIMKMLSDTIKDISAKLIEQKSIGKIESLPDKELTTIEDFEQYGETFTKINKAIDIEYEAVEMAIKNFEKVFGKDTMNVITGGSVSLKNLTPLIEFLQPYVEESRKKYTGKYVNDNSSVFK